jgi:hypothetical protein
VALQIMSSSPPQVIRLVSSGPGWLTLLATFLVGSAAALASQWVVQIYIVPKVEKRKRREDRWERDVRELGELLNMSLSGLAEEAHGAQWMVRELQREASDEYDPRLVAQQARDAQQAIWAYGNLIGNQVDWLIGRVRSINRKAPEIVRFHDVAGDYHRRAVMVRVAPGEDDNRPDTVFDDVWEKERAARKALIEQVEVLADLPRPPVRRTIAWERAQPAQPTGGSRA